MDPNAQGPFETGSTLTHEHECVLSVERLSSAALGYLDAVQGKKLNGFILSWNFISFKG